MNRIVEKPLKVDLHIHSCKSITKDNQELVCNGTKENLNILVNKLKEYDVNMAAITDHDCFSYEMYSSFKAFEGKDKLYKVLPGIEFSVGIKNEKGIYKDIHVIAIFDDTDDDKIRNIENVMKFNNGKPDYDIECKYYSEEKIISILNKIGLNVVLIAHQKNSVSSKNPQSNDLTSLGKEKFEEFLWAEVFDALEFKSMKNGLHNQLYAEAKNKDNDIVRFITGSDCHQWESYPLHDSSEISTDYKHTYLKCLPTFKGLCMALTDYSRIRLSDALFSNDDKKIDFLKLSISNNEYDIPLSRGINAIIGDNSIGKSLLIHKITNYKYLEDKKIKKGYEEYLKQKNIVIVTSVDRNSVYYFDCQGSIRKRFETKDENKNQEFLQNKFPNEPSKYSCRYEIDEQFKKLYDALQTKFDYDNQKKNLNCGVLQETNFQAKNISVSKIKNSKTKLSNFEKICKYFDKIVSTIGDPKNLISKGLEESDLNEIIQLKGSFEKLKNKYNEREDMEKNFYNLREGKNTGIDGFNNELSIYKSSLEKIRDNFNNFMTDTANTIAELIKLKRNIYKFEFDIKEEIPVVPNQLKYHEYNFIRRFKGIQKVNNEYLNLVLSSVLKSGEIIDSSIITEDNLNDIIKDDHNLPNLKALEILKQKINEKIDSDFEVESVILKANQDVYDNLSNGLNSTLYFDIISYDERQGIYIIDQPEDDVSQKAIKTNLLKDFKNMSANRQIILITHNPQFVVNLDVDNVILINKSENNEIECKYGALEYEDESTNIINLVAENLDGGIESIRKRWKRYGKGNKFN